MPHAEIDAKPQKPLFILKSAAALLHELDIVVGSASPQSGTARMLVLTHIRKTLTKAHQGAEAELLVTNKGMDCARHLCDTQDSIITAIYLYASKRVYPLAPPPDVETIAISAVGGYGRGALAPGSDIDLLFILPDSVSDRDERITEYILYLLWDLGQKVGHAVRSVDECIHMARADMTVRTATLEARFLTGNKDLFNQLMQRFGTEVMPHTSSEFIAAKMAERDERHRLMGNSRYVVEPNIKDGKGGLRDLNTLFWIGKYFYRLKTSHELVGQGVLSATEYRLFSRAENFLWAVRCHLHFITGRSEEKLTFDMQPELTRRMGYGQRLGMLAVERFMKRYFLIAKDVGDLTRIICACLEFNHAKDMDHVGHMQIPFRQGRSHIKGETAFVLDTGRLNIAMPDVFEADPVNLIRIFLLAGHEQLLLHPDAVKCITRSLRLIDNRLRADHRANACFLTLLTSPLSVERILRAMNETGVLGRFVPEFGKIVALMQFNMYHHYTVDEHLIRAVGAMADVANGVLREQLPLTEELLPHLDDTRLLYVALFLHDIAKGGTEDHSIAGSRIARRLCPRFGLSDTETDTVAWLIEHHLLMSEIAHSRDIQDPETARTFANVVQSPQRLALLMILTICDIRAVGPNTWTGWKGALLRALYYATEPLLSGSHSQINQHDRIEAARSQLARSLSDWSQEETATYLARHYDHYWLRTDAELQLEHAHMIQQADQTGAAFAASIQIKAFEGITEISFYARNHPRLLSFIANACTMEDVSIIGAQIFSTRDGKALNTFRLRRFFTSNEDEKVRATRIIDTVKHVLQGKRQLLVDQGKEIRYNQRFRPFTLPTRITVSNTLSEKFTVIEVSGLDRMGLLYSLTHAIANLNLTIASAHVGTYGEKVVDVFYVTDLAGQKIISESHQRQIHKALMNVFQPEDR